LPGEEDFQNVARSTGAEVTVESQPMIAIIGGVAGFFMLIIIVVSALFFYCYKNKKLKKIRYSLYMPKVIVIFSFFHFHL
jgi:hypothetical protein